MRDVRVEVDRSDLKFMPIPLFEKIFYNLIDNALKYGGGGNDDYPHILQMKPAGDSWLPARTTGPGFSGGDKQHLFERGYGKHTGLGLFLSREILSITAIAIAETGEAGRGARFEILVPKDHYRVIPDTGK